MRGLNSVIIVLDNRLSRKSELIFLVSLKAPFFCPFFFFFFPEIEQGEGGVLIHV